MPARDSGVRTMRAPAVAAVAVAVAVASCGDAATTRRAGAHCDRDARPRSAGRLYESLTEGRWAEVSAVTAREPATPPPRGMDAATVTVARVLRGTWPSPADVNVSRGATVEAAAELAGGARVLAAGDEETAGLIALRRDGTAHVLGDCYGQEFAPAFAALREIRAGQGDTRPVADIVLDVVTSPDGPTARAIEARVRPTAPPPSPTPWAGLPPDRRALSDAPAAVTARLRSREVVFHLPASWRDARVTICPRVRLGWGDCLLPSGSGRPAPLRVLTDGDEPVQLWLTEPGRNFHGERHLAFTIPAAELRGGTVHVYGSAAVASKADAVRLARRGTAFRL